MPGSDATRTITRAERIGRRVGVLCFAVIVGGCTLLWATQIFRQVWGTPDVVSVGPCRPALGGLIAAVRRARDAAASTPTGERVALARFRAALKPEWDDRPEVEIRCSRDPMAQKALAEIDRFRYAEEHSVRYMAADLSRRRRNIQLLERSLDVATSGPVEERGKD